MKFFLIFFTVMSNFCFASNIQTVEKKVGGERISFIRNSAAELDAKGEEKNYSAKTDFAQIEKLAPLGGINLAKIQATDLKNLSNEDFNQLYARLKSGSLFKGDYSGVILQKSPLFQLIKKKILKNFHVPAPLMSTISAACNNAPEDCLLEFLWKGKRFFPKNNFDQVEAQTLLSLPIGPSITLFPMNTYCGISQIDTRRESIIVDAAFGDDFASYVALRDEVVTRKNLNISEEYRQLRPGLYIGKVYSNKVFMFNVALQEKNPSPTESINACFDGTKTR